MKSNSSTIPPVELKSLLPAGCCLVDVREPVEHAGESIAGARLIPLGELEKRLGEIDRRLPVVVMCHAGSRGERARQTLEKLGISGVRNLAGGIEGWKSAGLPVDRPERKPFPLMRQVQIAIGTGVLTGVVLSRFVHPDFIYLSGFFGAGLIFAGSTGWCGLAILMSKMPWNRMSGVTSCSTGSCATSH